MQHATIHLFAIKSLHAILASWVLCRHRRMSLQCSLSNANSRTLSRRLPDKLVKQAMSQAAAGSSDPKTAPSLQDPPAAGSTGSPSSPFSKWLQLGQPTEPELLQIEARALGTPKLKLCPLNPVVYSLVAIFT